MCRKTTFAASVVVIVLAGAWVVVSGQSDPCPSPGCPDPTFGGTGIVTTPSLRGSIGQTAVQTLNGEERIVGQKTSPGNWVMVRYRANGQLDTSFGTAGVYTRSFDTGYPQAYGVLAQRDNKLVVLSSQPSDVKGWSKIVVTRYLPNAPSVAPGPFDTTFGQGGEVALGLYYSVPGGMVLQSDGKIVVVSRRSGYLALHRLLPSGALDSEFGTGGVAEFADSDSTYLRGVVIEPVPGANDVMEERIVVSSGVNTTGALRGPYSARLQRFMPDGTPDATFGIAGTTTVGVPGAESSEWKHLAVDGGGRIVAVGSYCLRALDDSLDYYPIAARYTVDGQLDSDFANDGIYRQDSLGHNHQMRGVAVHPDGRIVIVGLKHGTDYPYQYPLVVWRLLDNGNLDSSFGINGMMTTTAMLGDTIVQRLAFVRAGTAFAVGGCAYVKVGQKGKNPIMANVFAAGRFLY